MDSYHCECYNFHKYMYTRYFLKGFTRKSTRPSPVCAPYCVRFSIIAPLFGSEDWKVSMIVS